MPRVKNKTFIPVNKQEAKEVIQRPMVHNEENYDHLLFKQSKRIKLNLVN